MDIIKYENFSKAGTDSLKKYLHLLSKKRSLNIFLKIKEILMMKMKMIQ